MTQKNAAPLALVAVLAGCSHGPAPARAGAPTWPSAPEPAVARWLASVPDPLAPPPEAPLWRRVLDTILGLDSTVNEDRIPLERPYGIAATGTELWVADPDGRRVLRGDWRSGDLSPIPCEGRDWVIPIALARGPHGELYVADAGLAEVARIDSSGECAWIGAGALIRPTGVVATRDRIWVADPPGQRVIAFSRDGRELARLGDSGEDVERLSFPTSLALAPDGSLLVVDALHFRIAVYSPDGRFLRSYGEGGQEPGTFGRPKAIAVDARGRAFVSDAELAQVLVFAPDGRFDLAIGGAGLGPGQLSVPAGVAVDGARLFVADSFNRRVEVYELLGGGS